MRCSHNKSLCINKMSEVEFQAAADDVQNLKKRPSDKELLELYGLFKQVNEGDNTTTRPGMLDFKGKAKWDAWDSRKGMSKSDAMTEYISLAKGIIKKYTE